MLGKCYSLLTVLRSCVHLYEEIRVLGVSYIVTLTG